MSALAGPFCEERVPVEYPLLLPQSAGSSRHRVVSINNLRSHQTATRPLTNCGENHLHREISESFWGTSDYSGISTENSTNQYDWGRKSACMKWWMIKLLGVSLQCIGPPAKMTRSSWKNAQTPMCNFPFCCDNFWSMDVAFLLSMQTHNEVIVPTVGDGRGKFFLHGAGWGKAKKLWDGARPGKGSKYAGLGMAGAGNIMFISVDWNHMLQQHCVKLS